MAKVFETIEWIREYPGMGRIADDGKKRIVVIDNFLLFYEVRENGIYIMSFWHGKQNPKFRIDNPDD